MILTRKKYLSFEKESQKKYYRIQKLIEVLVNLDQKFDCRHDAYKHIYECLNIIEKAYVPSDKPAMTMISFQGFNFCMQSELYFSDELRKHSVIIHKNGAYAIYRSKIEIKHYFKFLDWKLYRRNSTCLVQIKNSKNQSIWENHYRAPTK
jgi:hypothetical protein